MIIIDYIDYNNLDEKEEGKFYGEIDEMLKTCFENDEHPDKSIKPITKIKRENKRIAILYDSNASMKMKIQAIAFIYFKKNKTIKIIGVCSSSLGAMHTSKKEKSYASLLIDDIIKKYKDEFTIELSVYIYNSYFIKAYNLYKRNNFVLRNYNKDTKEFDMFYMPLKIQFNPVTSIDEWISHLDDIKEDEYAYDRMIRIIADALDLYDVSNLFDKIWKIFIELKDENPIKTEYLKILLKYEPKLSEKLKSFEKLTRGLRMTQANTFKFIFENTDNQTLKEIIKKLVNDFPIYMKTDFSFKVKKLSKHSKKRSKKRSKKLSKRH